MPLRPILSRDRFYDVLPDGTIVDLPFALVQTPLGAMIETVSNVVAEGNDVLAQDASFNTRTQLNRDTAAELFNFDLRSPMDFSRLPAGS